MRTSVENALSKELCLEQKYAISFLVKSGKRFIECIDSLKSVYGDSALHISTGWRVFKSVVDNGEGNMRRGRTSTAEKHMPKIDQLIRDDSRGFSETIS